MLIRNLFQYGAWTPESTHAVAVAIMIQCLVLPAMLTSQIYSKTLYASQDVKTPVKTSIVSLGLATVIYVALFYHLGYLAIPVGVVVSGYVKNLLLARACKRKGLIQWDSRTIRATIGFCIWATILGAGLWFAPISGLISMCIAIAVFGILYLPVAYIMDRKL